MGLNTQSGQWEPFQWKKRQLSLDKKVTHKNGVNPSLYRPGNEQIELGIAFIARNGHLVAFYIFGEGVNKKLGLWDVTDSREVWHI